jgi:hypothetical protein
MNDRQTQALNFLRDASRSLPEEWFTPAQVSELLKPSHVHMAKFMCTVALNGLVEDKLVDRRLRPGTGPQGATLCEYRLRPLG